MTPLPAQAEWAVVGHAGGSGLASNAAMFRAAFQGLGIGHRFHDAARLKVGPRQPPVEPDALAATRALYAVNADVFAAVRAGFEARRQTRAPAPAIGFFLWETTRAPRLHRLVRPLLDEVWVPTEFVRQVYRKLYDDALAVVNIGKCVALPPDVAARAADQPSPGAPFVFLNIADFDSSIRRKHPLPVVRAFRRAFPADADVRLVLKVRRVDLDHWSNAGQYWQQVLRAIGDDRRIRIVQGDLPSRDYWRLLQSSDCLVSLHRAEGFCYGAAHAMLLGVPVIATDFSGNQDFCTPQTSWPVSAELVPVQPGEMQYHEDLGLWASPDIDHAAQQMQAVRQGGADVAARRACGQQRLAQQYSAEQFQANLRARLSRF